MSKITILNRSSSQTILPNDQQLIKKRLCPDETNSISKKKIKRSIDVTSHWKKIQAVYEPESTKIFECKSKNDCKINHLFILS
jgi:hypothetical protein